MLRIRQLNKGKKWPGEKARFRLNPQKAQGAIKAGSYSQI